MADWERAEEDLRWALKTGKGVDGREVLFEALSMSDMERARRALHNGFMMSFRDDGPTGNFVACEEEDGLRLYNLARTLVGAKPVEG